MRNVIVRVENIFAAVATIALVVLPLADIVTHQFSNSGILGADPLIQHLALWVGMLGAALAARDGKLLALATGTMLPEGRVRHVARVCAAAAGAAVATIFAVGGVALVGVDRLFETRIGPDVPLWAVDAVFPFAFGLIALRLAWNASGSRIGRLAAASGIVAGYFVASHPASIAGDPAWPWLAALVVAAVLGAPIFALLGGAAMVLFLVQGSKPVVPLIAAYGQLTSSSLPAIPLFTLAGFLLAEGRSSDRLLRMFRALFGGVPGGTAVVTAALCAFFTTFTGGSGVTILALGGLLLPALLADGYRDRFSLGLITASGSLGLLFPPSMPLILYGIIAANAGIEDLFIGGLLPGLLMLALVAALGVREGLTIGARGTGFSPGEALASAWAAKWELLLPVVVLASLFGGFATLVQSAALAALFALVVQRFVHRDLSNGDVIRVVGDAVALIGGVLLILAVAVGLTNYLVDAEVPARLVDWTRAHIESPTMFLLALNVFLLVVGCVMDIYSAIVVVVPLIVPLASAFGIHPVHLGVIFIANLELGYLTPPVGLNLFLASYRFKRPLLEVARSVLPPLAILAGGVLLITYVPWLTLGLLRLFGRG
jgi:C4-dicarboxylate transporter DctM subunit